MQSEVKVVSELNLKFPEIKFKVMLPKQHEGIGAVEQVIGVIKNTLSKSVTGANLIKMNDEELLTWLNLVIQKINNRPLILSAPLGITLTPNHILLGFRNTHGEEVIRRYQFSVNSPDGKLLFNYSVLSGLKNSLDATS